MIVVASENGIVGMAAAMEILRAGGSALDAVEAATKLVELNVDDHSVGVGGYPNILGQVELDASIMEGATRRAGAVAALQGFLHPISIARAIMEKLPQHLLLVGDGAAQFADEHGFSRAELLTDETRAAWERIMEDVTRQGGGLTEQTTRAQDPEKTVGTVNFLAMDRAGHMASAVSTSGWAFKYPGRAGDSPIIGAGNLCDDRYGACACTGLGELAIRSGTARMVLMGLELGLSLSQACRRAMVDIHRLSLPDGLERIMSLVAIDCSGRHAGYSTAPGRQYIWQMPDMDTYETTERTVISG